VSTNWNSGENLVELRDSDDVVGDPSSLRNWLTGGYLFIREFHDSDEIYDVRETLLTKMVKEDLLHEDEPKEETVNITGTFWTQGPATLTPNLKTITEGDDVMDSFRGLLGKNPLAYDRGLPGEGREWVHGISRQSHLSE
jgi:hypothetical protein